MWLRKRYLFCQCIFCFEFLFQEHIGSVHSSFKGLETSLPFCIIRRKFQSFLVIHQDCIQRILYHLVRIAWQLILVHLDIAHKLIAGFFRCCSESITLQLSCENFLNLIVPVACGSCYGDMNRHLLLQLA